MNRSTGKIRCDERPSNLDINSSSLKKEEILSPFDSGTGMSMTDLSSDLDIETDESTSLSNELTVQHKEDTKRFSSSTTLDSGCNLDSGYDIKGDFEDECLSAEIPLESIKEVQSTLQIINRNFHSCDYQDNDGDTPLHLAVVKGNYEVSFRLISNCSCYLNVLNKLYQSPLHLAVLAKQPILVRRLVIAGALVDLQDHCGNTAFHWACYLGNYECLRALTVPAIPKEIDQSGLKYAPINGLYRFKSEVSLIRNYEGQTCVHLAVNGGCKVLDYMMRCGADINIKDGRAGQTPLHIAIQSQQAPIVQQLLGPSRLDVRNYAGYTPLELGKKIQKYQPDNTIANLLVSIITRELQRREPDAGLESQGEEVYDSEENSSDEDYYESEDSEED